jgi:hypothetical protein
VSVVWIVLPAYRIWTGKNKILSVGIDAREKEQYMEIQKDR